MGSVGGEDYLFFPLICPCLIDFYTGRACPGKHLAHSLVMLTLASVLSAFDLVREVDENGREIVPKREYSFAGIR